MASAPQLIINLASVALAEAAKLTRIPLAVLGRWVKGNQKFSITPDDLKSLRDNFRKRGNHETVIDYEHASEFPEVAQGGPIPAAGWVRDIESEPDADGVLWGLAEFTKRARDLIANREYKYLSPAIDWGARDKETGDQQGATLTSVALVNRPFLEALPAITLSEIGWQSQGGGAEQMTLTQIDRQINERVHQKMRENSKLDYPSALKLVASEDPALIAQHKEALRGGGHRPLARSLAAQNVELKELDAELDRKIRARMKEDRSLGYLQAVRVVASENLDLMEKRRALILRG